MPIPRDGMFLLRLRPFPGHNGGMRRCFILLLLLPLLGACQNSDSGQNPTGANKNFDPNSRQTYNIQTGDFQQQPPFGARFNQGG